MAIAEDMEEHIPASGAAIGTFDGMHCGHRQVTGLLRELCEARRLRPLAITFDRHPLSVIAPDRTPTFLTPLPKKLRLLREAGMMPVVKEFDENLRSTTAEKWLRHLHDDYGVQLLVVGYDTTFGCDGLNLSIADYMELGKKCGIEVIEAEELPEISSSAIRKAVKAGDVDRARAMLGRPFSITGKVVKGNQLGRVLGFPTANILPEAGGTIPKEGVYAAIVKLSDGSKHKAMVNVGVRPTVGSNSEKVIEAHLIGWEGDLYGSEITVRFLKRLRDEQKFDTIEALKNHLRADREEVERLAE